MTRPRLSAFSVLGVGAMFALAGCFGPPAPTPTTTSAAPTAAQTQPATTSATATPTASPTEPVTASPTATAPSSSAPPSTSEPASPAPSADPTFTGFPEQVAPLTLYYVAVGDNGISGPRIGCGDSLVATTTAPVRFTDQVGPSIGTLLANKSRDVGLSGLVNVLYQSNLTYLGGELNGSTITIWLTGQFTLGGVCDIPRAKAQLEYTAMAASDATSAQVFVDGRPIDEVLSLK
ncbi:hypothetical protein [[Micrococcus luteus] ATCC 49442]|uniref:hypothetical protein n=1 Tax=[Micrococcus luteus] ATCC 49442 TaxID=2698727 RepID=UPI001FCAF21A|nr:hypothetical protein [[Micrococcus luteus] ATCC 49442]